MTPVGSEDSPGRGSMLNLPVLARMAMQWKFLLPWRDGIQVLIPVEDTPEGRLSEHFHPGGPLLPRAIPNNSANRLVRNQPRPIDQQQAPDCPIARRTGKDCPIAR